MISYHRFAGMMCVIAVAMLAVGQSAVSAPTDPPPFQSPASGHSGKPVVAAAPSDDMLGIKPYQEELIGLAFEAVTKMPLNPHIKNRARGQQEVVETCLDMDMPDLALEFTQQMPNWRRGLCLAKYAVYQARRGMTDGLEAHLEKAEEIAETAGQDWRRERVLATVAEARVWIGQSEEADRVDESLEEPSEVGKVEAARIQSGRGTGDEGYEQQAAALEALGKSGRLETMETALESYLWLYEQNFSDPARRKEVEDRIRGVAGKSSMDLSVEALFAMADLALRRGDRELARGFSEELAEVIDSLAFFPEHEIPVRSRLAALRWRVGDAEAAQRDLTAAIEMYEQSRDRILSIDRAGVLRVVAECHLVMEDRDAALETFRLAVEEGVVNPNSRPRAFDLSATCLSLAEHELEPDTEMFARLRELNDQLGQPW